MLPAPGSGCPIYARHHARAVLRAHPNFTIAHWRKVPPVRRPEDLDLSVAAMRKAGLR